MAGSSWKIQAHDWRRSQNNSVFSLSFFQWLSLFFDKEKEKHKNVNSEQSTSHSGIYITLWERKEIFFIDFWNKYLFLYYQPTNVKADQKYDRCLIINKPYLSSLKFTNRTFGTKGQWWLSDFKYYHSHSPKNQHTDQIKLHINQAFSSFKKKQIS